MKKFLAKIESIAKKVFKQLSGLKEEHFQTALGVEFRKNKIDFMREAGLELFYESHPIGLHELDFLIMPCLDLKVPLIIETKLAKLTEEKIEHTIIFTKTDKIKKKESQENKEQFQKALTLPLPYIMVSSKKKIGKDRLIKQIEIVLSSKIKKTVN